MLNSVGLAPPSAACPIPVSVTFPVLVSENTWVGAPSTPTPLVAFPKLRNVGVRAALSTGATPVPLSPTGEPATVTFAVIVTVPVFEPVVVGENVTVIVQEAPAAKVAPQVPPGRAN
jgi:hypothetical protein